MMLFDSLCEWLNVRPERDGEALLSPCISCGKESRNGHIHCSFSERGYHCFVCQASGSLAELAHIIGLDGAVSSAAPPAPVRPKRPFEPGRYPDYLVKSAKYAAWALYAPALSSTMIDAYRLGLGAFPGWMSKCQHERLMVPLHVCGHLVGYRGRVTSCGCTKWLSPSGSRMILYNGMRLGAEGDTIGDCMDTWRAIGRVLWIVENPIDALLVEQRVPGAAAVAILGASCWKDEWTDAVAISGAESVIVALDNDQAGLGSTLVARKAWLDSGHKEMEPNGIKLANKLLRAGIRRVSLFPWTEKDPVKADLGDLLRK